LECSLEAAADSYLSLGEAMAGVRGTPRGSEKPLVQVFIEECSGQVMPASISSLLGRDAALEALEVMADRGLTPSPVRGLPRDSLAHLAVFMGLLAVAEGRGDDTAATARLQLIDDILAPIIERLRGHGGYCEGLLAEALAEVVEEDRRCLGV
jgi:hypothetical protein